jgi:AAA15 family ATPase/GTPase
MSPIFQEVAISSYRGLQNICLTDLKQANILVGNNNSGKTSILEVISILCNPINPLTWIDLSQRRVSTIPLRRGFLIRPDFEAIEWMFPRFDESLAPESKGIIAIRGKSSKLTSEIKVLGQFDTIQGSGNPNIDEKQDDNTPEDIDPIQEGVELNISTSPPWPIEQLNLFDENPDIPDTTEVNFQFWQNERFVYRSKSSKYFESLMISPSYLGEEQIVRKLSTIIRRDESQKEDLIKLIQLFDENILDFQVLLGQYQAKLYLKHRVLGLTPLYIFGDGIKRVLGIAMNVLTLRNGGVLLIDEIETSIHKSILGDAFRWLLKLCTVNKIQLFITTHSLEAVDAILGASDSVDDLAAFRLKSQQESPQRFTGDLLQRLRFDRGLDMR